MEKEYQEHVDSAVFLIGVLQAIIGFLGVAGFIAVLCVCSFGGGQWSLLWPYLLVIPASTLVSIMLLALFKHIYLSFVLKTDYYERPSKAQVEQHEETRPADPKANNQDGYK